MTFWEYKQLEPTPRAHIVKPEERAYLIALYGSPLISPRYLETPTHHKRVWWYLRKWSERKDPAWYMYGTTLDLGWLTDVGKAQARFELAALEDG